MTKKVKLLKSKDYKSREEVSKFLHELADKIASGSVSMAQGDQDHTFQIPDSIVLEIEAEQKDKGIKGLQQELEIELKWYEGGRNGDPLKLK